jgi:two-component system sensor histidine kinase KdpD
MRPGHPFTRRIVARYCVSTLAIAAIVALYLQRLHVNETTVALTFLLVILVVAARWGLRHSVYLSVLSALAFNFFFLPPVFTFTIGDAQNWVALTAFVLTGVIGSQLAERAREEAEHARRRQRETEKLYDLSQTMLLAGNVIELLNAVPYRIATTFHLDGVAIYLLAGERIYRSHPEYTRVTASELREAAFSRNHITDSSRSLTLVPILLGTRTLGAMALTGNGISPEILDAICGLVAIAVERVSAMDAVAQVKASHESERMRNALLDSVTLELVTPLSCIATSIRTLRANDGMDAAERTELIKLIEKQSDRLEHLVHQSMEMSELEVRELTLNKQPHTMQAALDLALSESKDAFADHPLRINLPTILPTVEMDLDRIGKVLQHLLDNAAKYSPAGSPIFVSAEVENGSLITSVADRGVGVEDNERLTIFDKFSRGREQRYRVQGTGMGLAIAKAIVDAHGGTMELTSQPGYGSVFSFTLPLRN